MNFSRFTKAIQTAAGFTFSLYLFHMPIVCLVAALLPASMSAYAKGICLAGVALAASWALGLVTERKKHLVKGALILVARLLFARPTAKA